MYLLVFENVYRTKLILLSYFSKMPHELSTQGVNIFQIHYNTE